jgi:predicted enzyme related to lactoylglutathione lyase
VRAGSYQRPITGTPVAPENILSMIEYPEGTPCWVDLSSPDVDASARFYGGLFGWIVAEETGDQRTFTLDAAPVAGLALAQAGQPPAWNTYVAVDDVAATKKRVEAAGGGVVMDAGTTAILTDAAGGASFAVRQANRHGGAQLVNAPRALTMNELDTRDFEGAARFYGEVFGWEVAPVEVDGAVQYGGFRLAGRLVAGILPMGAGFPPEVPPHWVPYFGIDDLDAGSVKAQELGGQVLTGPTPVPQGRFVALRDPQGAVFRLWEGSYDPPPGS